MKCNQKVLKLRPKWRTYNQICDDMGNCGFNYGTIERTVRRLVESNDLITRTVSKKIDGKIKVYSEFKKVVK
jgi:hypothetical protein